MLSTINPGIYVAAAAELSPTVITLSAFGLVVGLGIIIGSFMAETIELAFIGLLTVALGGMLPIVASAPDPATPTKAEYTETVRDWLADDYGITVNVEDATKLTAGRELALAIDDRATAIQLIDGENGTIAVKVVGGSIIEPVEDAAK
jgi:hypothetical protein